ncbi:MAG: pilus assembly protein [Leptothrix sp. (in: b-proteobacteria)]
MPTDATTACRALWRAGAALLALAASASHAADIDLADTPLFSTVQVPGNLALALSVEWPTASTPAYPSTVSYAVATTYYGYFDAAKCYRYVSVYNSAAADYSSSYFQPDSAASSHACSSSAAKSLWSGNYLNWASTHTLDAFRWALTGGMRDVDDASSTILAKTYHAGDGAHSSIYPDKQISSGVSGATPFNWSAVSTRIWKGGTRMWVTGTATSTLGADTTPPTGTLNYTGLNSYSSPSSSRASASAIYEVYIRVKVCDTSVGVETNCVAYPAGNYKPEGLMQQYAMKLRYAAFGYLNDGNVQRDGGVLRARMAYIGPQQPVPGSAAISNSAPEWNTSNGVMLSNPDATDATATQSTALAQSGYSVSVTSSGVLNYLNRFGLSSKTYKSYDPVSELYDAALRYFKNIGNVPAYSSLAGAGSASTLATWVDGFPVITNWTDPILYSCQKNFILGIGDVNSWADANLNGSTIRSNEPSMPTEVSADTSVNVKTATDMVGQLEGISNLGSYSSGRNNSYFIAGLAYDAHTHDIRSDLVDTQTVSTYWVDVLEGQTYLPKNQYWLAAKYGGFEVPAGFSPYAGSNGTGTLPSSAWDNNADTLTNGSTTNPRPDNYFTGGQADKIISGLGQAFAKIAAEASAATSTALASISPNEAYSGSANYAASYDPKTWSGTVTGSTISYASDGTPTLTAAWNASSLLDASSATNRKIVTCCTSTGAALPFRSTNLTAATLSSRTAWSSTFANVSGVASGVQSAANFLNYLRGDKTFELSAGGPYRSRSHLLGDIVDAKLTPIGAPAFTYYDRHNPGYSAFRRSYKSRKTVVYAGANDGMLHAFDGALSGTSAGSELFAYIPSFLYGDATSGPVSGLAALGNPNYLHRNYVDATPQVFDLDFNRAGTAVEATTSDWRSVLIGGLGKGGKGYYAIDVTDPSAWTSESAVAGKVLWEFTDSRLGYSYGDARVVKTAKYGWVALLASGYNNADGKGYIFILNPKTGALLETLATPDGSTTAPINLAHLSAYIPDLSDYSATALYSADLQGNVWRVDLSPASGSYAAPLKIARLTDPSGQPQPVTTPVRVMVEPDSLKRYLLVGTGRLLADSDVAGTQVQSFYALIDGTADAFYTSATLPSGVSFPVTRTDLNANAPLAGGIGSAPAKSMGWYADLGRQSGSNIAERITVTPSVNNGIVGVAVNLPTGDACSTAGSSYVFAVGYATGKTVLTDNSGATIATTGSSSGVVSELAFKNVGGRIRLIAGRSSGSISNLPGSFGRDGALRRLNWREVPTMN